MGLRTGIVLVALSLPILGGAPPLSGQDGVQPGWTVSEHDEAAGPVFTVSSSSSDDWRAGASGQLVAAGANVLVGGLTAGIRQWRGEGSFREGFLRGAAGGMATYAGKRLVVEDFPAAGFAGRGVAAVGASMTRNASEGRSTFDRLIVPVGPFRLHWERGEGTLRTSLDLLGTATLIGMHLSSLDASLDLRRTFRAGAPVFLARNHSGQSWHGRQLGGSVVLRDAAAGAYPSGFWERVMAHEQVHVLQYDQAYILWGEPLEKGLLGRLGVPEGVTRRVDLSLFVLGYAGLRLLVSDASDPWEVEADILSGTWRDRP